MSGFRAVGLCFCCMLCLHGIVSHIHCCTTGSSGFTVDFLTSVSDKNPVVDGEVSTIEIKRTCPDLGMSIVGGVDTPLVSVYVCI